MKGESVDTLLHGYLAHKEQRPPRTLQQDYAQGPTVVLWGLTISYERGTPVGTSTSRKIPDATFSKCQLSENPSIFGKIVDF